MREHRRHIGSWRLERPLSPSFPTTSFRHLFGLQTVANVFVTMWSLSFPDICACRVHKNSYIYFWMCVNSTYLGIILKIIVYIPPTATCFKAINEIKQHSTQPCLKCQMLTIEHNAITLSKKKTSCIAICNI